MNYEKKYLKYKKKYMMMRGGGINPYEQIDPITKQPFKINNCNPLGDEIPCSISIRKNKLGLSRWTILRNLKSEGAEAKKRQQQGDFGDVFFGYLDNPEQIKIIKNIILDYKNDIEVKSDLTPEQKIEYIKQEKDKIINNEICLQNIAADLNISPKIEDYWKCENSPNAVIIMEKVSELTLTKFLHDVLKSMDEMGVGDTDISKIRKLYNVYIAIKFTIAKFIKLNHNNIIQGDSHFNNVMVSLDGEGDVVNVHIIDYGKAKSIKQLSEEMIEKVAENNRRGLFLDNTKIINSYNDFIHHDINELLYNNKFGIKIRITEFERFVKDIEDEKQRTTASSAASASAADIKDAPLIARLIFKYCNEFRINSIFYYYALLVISEDLEKNIAKHYKYRNKDEINDTIRGMYTNFETFIDTINGRIKKDIQYFMNLGLKFYKDYDTINEKISSYEAIEDEEANVEYYKLFKVLNKKISPIFKTIMSIDTKT